MEISRRDITPTTAYGSSTQDVSLVARLLAAFDRLDVEAVMALLAPQPRVLTADGRRAEGAQAVRELLENIVMALRSSSHEIDAQWHWDNVWVAEVHASYELRDWLRLPGLPRAVVLRESAAGVTDVHIYGAREHPITEHRTGEEGMLIGGRWIPPL